MKRVLITGANGFTGRVLTRMLRNDDWQVTPLVQEPAGLKGEVVLDFCDPRFNNRLRCLPEVDAVVHLGARIGWDGSSPEDLFQPNLLATSQLVQWAVVYEAFFVFASAALICGEHNPHITADCGLNTKNPYLYSKWLAEELIVMSGLKHAILRISGIFGKNGPSHLGINNAITNALAGTPPELYGSGDIKRNYIYVKDLCRIIKHCIETPVQGVHLVGGKENLTIAEMLTTICSVLLPGTHPVTREGDSSHLHHQVVEPSPHLPQGRTFKEAIEDIRADESGP